MLEGLQAKDWLLTAQVKVQILLYASIYEAVLHHVLMQEYAGTPEVTALSSYEHRKPINISGDIRLKIQNTYSPTGPISVYETETRPIDERKIVFEEKAETARMLGLIDQTTKDIVCNVYSLRNAIHLHAELRRGIAYQIDAAKDAYWHLQGFCQQISDKLVADGKVAPRPAPPIKAGAATAKNPPRGKAAPIPATSSDQSLIAFKPSWLQRIGKWMSSK